jgi:hypothetical protein
MGATIIPFKDRQLENLLKNFCLSHLRICLLISLELIKKIFFLKINFGIFTFSFQFLLPEVKRGEAVAWFVVPSPTSVHELYMIIA